MMELLADQTPSMQMQKTVQTENLSSEGTEIITQEYCSNNYKFATYVT